MTVWACQYQFAIETDQRIVEEFVSPSTGTGGKGELNHAVIRVCATADHYATTVDVELTSLFCNMIRYLLWLAADLDFV